MRRLTAGVALLVVLLSGCAAGEQGDAPASTSAAPASSAPAEPTPSTVDPRTITGPSTAATVAEPEPIADPEPQLPVTATGVDGVTVEVADVSRVLALDLYGTLTETVIALGLADTLVGRANTSTESVVADLPVVTQNGHELQAEAILDLDPTFVIMDDTMGPPEVPEQLRASGVPVLVVASERGVDLIAEQVLVVADAFGVSDAGETLVADFEERLAAAELRVGALAGDWEPLRMAFLYVRGTGSVFFVMGEGSGADDLIDAIGGLDAPTEAGVQDIAPATAEAVLAIDPEVILTMTGGLASTGGVDGFVGRPGVSDTVAGRTQRIVDMADGEVLSFGPSYPEVLVSLAEAVYAP
ncbi:heme/hemin ABC transporter substrate-binding protein [Agrococcus jejuensis]|uniref:Iron complex transport system substrate-binding protein n=1 Tax=Agrococcus jejuensis TaxID=399736 RepID=A0A1G8B6T2_9MICO|nr:ABC transporter substrate-binding protein [Agrococcus jejuensis]SDH28851.1 iron complex transport system substrate-binding protein [Agrococcus jejuensis]